MSDGMSNGQIEYAIDTIDRFLESNYPEVKAEAVMGEHWLQEYKHLKHMVIGMREQYATEYYSIADREKLMRWLGFAQGALWALEDFTVDELREMNTKELD